MMRCPNTFKACIAALLLGIALPAFGASADDGVTQKLNFVDMFISSSAASKRIAASDNGEARAKYQAAQERLTEAKGALASGNLEEARTKSDEAMGLMSKAAQLVPSESTQQMARARNEKLVQSLEALKASYKAALSEQGARGPSGLDSGAIQAAMDAASTLAEAGKYDEANRILAATLSEVSGAIKKLLTSKTVSYEMNFSSRADEYAYELERYASLENLVPVVIEKRQPSRNELNLVEIYTSKAKQSRQQADADAKQERYAAALEKIRSGTQQLETALKLLGVTY